MTFFLRRLLLAFSLITLVTWLFTLFSYRSSTDDFSRLDLQLIALCAITICVVGAVISTLFARWPRIYATLVGLFGIANVFTGHLALSSEFTNQSTPLIAMYLAMLVTVLAVATLATMRHKGVAIGLLGFLVLGNAYVTYRAFDYEPDPKAAGALLPHASEDLRNFVRTKFKKKPNVYLFSYDSILPRSLIKKHFDAEEKPYHKVLDKHFRKFDNFFSDSMNTRPSLNLLLALDAPYMKSLKPKQRYRFYQGTINSPLLATFKANGYETTTAYASRYLGRKKGPYVDNYLIFQQTLVCKFLPKAKKRYALYGICNKKVFPHLFKVLGIPRKTDWVALEALVKSVKRISARPSPQIVVAYVFLPGHSPLNYARSEEEKRTYFERYDKRSELAASAMTRMVEAVRANDPDGIILTFGDHGPWLSRGIDPEVTDDLTFIIQDRYGVYGGISPKDICPEIFDRKRKRTFNTPRLIAREIVACLRDDPEGQDKIFGDTKSFKVLLDNRYEDFLYE